MSTNRPFFANFLAAFRAHTAIQQASSATSTAANTHSTSQPGRSPAITASNPRSISTSTKAVQTPGSTTAAVQAAAGHLQSAMQHSTSPISAARSPRSPAAASPPGFGGKSTGRRDSDSSTEGFRDALGTEKWYIGGRTAAGEERFYRLGMARRHRSIDRLSLDRLSL